MRNVIKEERDETPNEAIGCPKWAIRAPIMGELFTKVLKKVEVLLGIKVDKGTVELLLTNDETTTQGLDDINQRCKKDYEAGSRFSKWRAILKIDPNEPSSLSIHENTHSLACYAVICQENGLVPIVELEILVDGSHDIAKCTEVTELVLEVCYKALSDHHVLLEGTLLKLNMVIPGSYSTKVALKSTLKAWGRKPENIPRAQVALLVRCNTNLEATLGNY
ncbi:hypothetical protein KIW84_073766 [Lathyrus oleraceus]|uniref:fructose-bisphosphate aldolase n=1 Tax=Pisum sativum TaxID=3888 RepID=A0A9D4ZZH7_PEA|nr:hypothetical protein KIW84_073766 [Pisum sativum]